MTFDTQSHEIKKLDLLSDLALPNTDECDNDNKLEKIWQPGFTFGNENKLEKIWQPGFIPDEGEGGNEHKLEKIWIPTSDKQLVPAKLKNIQEF